MSAKDIDIIGQKQINTENIRLQGLNAEAAALAEVRRSNAASGERMAESEARQAREELKKLKLHYQLLLAKPMHQIAELSGDFRRTYEAQQLLMAEWMVSQKAFKELAIQYGMKTGKTVEQVIEEGVNKMVDVIENRHEKSHKTNSFDGNVIAPYGEKIIEKYKIKIKQ